MGKDASWVNSKGRRGHDKFNKKSWKSGSKPKQEGQGNNGWRDGSSGNQNQSRVPRKKYAICFGYLGMKYRGMARLIDRESGKDEHPTVEGDLVHGMANLKMIPEDFRYRMGKLTFSRVGRTDKGVHAAGQLVGTRMDLGEIDDELKSHKNNRLTGEMTELEKDPRFYTRSYFHATEEQLNGASALLNRIYPEAFKERDANFNKDDGFKQLLHEAGRQLDAARDIQRHVDPEGLSWKVHGLLRVTSAFDARRRCSGRHYEYLLPSWILCPMKWNSICHPEVKHYTETSSIMTWMKVLDMTEEDLSQQHCINQPCEMHRTNPRKMHTFLPPWTAEDTMLSSRLEMLSRLRKSRGIIPITVPEGCAVAEEKSRPLWEEYIPENFKGKFLSDANSTAIDEHENKIYGLNERMRYRLNETDIEKLRTIFSEYEGTHSFHNFTSGIQAGNPSAIRCSRREYYIYEMCLLDL